MTSRFLKQRHWRVGASTVVRASFKGCYPIQCTGSSAVILPAVSFRTRSNLRRNRGYWKIGENVFFECISKFLRTDSDAGKARIILPGTAASGRKQLPSRVWPDCHGLNNCGQSSCQNGCRKHSGKSIRHSSFRHSGITMPMQRSSSCATHSASRSISSLLVTAVELNTPSPPMTSTGYRHLQAQPMSLFVRART